MVRWRRRGGAEGGAAHRRVLAHARRRRERDRVLPGLALVQEEGRVGDEHIGQRAGWIAPEAPALAAGVRGVCGRRGGCERASGGVRGARGSVWGAGRAGGARAGGLAPSLGRDRPPMSPHAQSRWASRHAPEPSAETLEASTATPHRASRRDIVARSHNYGHLVLILHTRYASKSTHEDVLCAAGMWLDDRRSRTRRSSGAALQKPPCL